MESFSIELEVRVPVFLTLTIQAEDIGQARSLAQEAVTCLNAKPALTIPDIIGKAMPDEDAWEPDCTSPEDWELVSVDAE